MSLVPHGDVYDLFAEAVQPFQEGCLVAGEHLHVHNRHVRSRKRVVGNSSKQIQALLARTPVVSYVLAAAQLIGSVCENIIQS